MSGISLSLAKRIIDGREPDEVIERDGRPIFERWWLLRTPSDAAARGGNVYLHRWLLDDQEEPHDHPWWNETTVLAGLLVEELFCPRRIGLYHLGKATPVTRTLQPGDSALREADAIHRVVHVERGTITLFVTGKKTRDWGFWRNGQFVHWRDYHRLPSETPASYRAGQR